MNGFIFSDKQENCKKNFKYVCAAAIIAIMLGVSLDCKKDFSKYLEQSGTAGQQNIEEESAAEHYCNGGNPSDGPRERTPLPDGSAEEEKRQEIPKLERYRLGTGRRRKKVVRGRKRGRKFCSPQQRKKPLRPSEAKIEEEKNKRGNLGKKAEEETLPAKKEREVLPDNGFKHRLIQAMIIAVLVVTALVSYMVSHPVTAESLPFWNNSPIGIAMGTILPALAAPYKREVANQKVQESGEVSPANHEIFRKRQKISIEEQAILYQKLCANRHESSKEVLSSSCEVKIEISISQLNRIRKKWGLSRKKGRPRTAEKCAHGERERVKTSVQAKAGVKLFSHWLDENDKHEKPCNAIKVAIEVYKEACAGEDFRLLHAKADTIQKKWKALTLLSLLGIKHLSELDYHEHNLASIVGSHYTYSTLSQFLGELERLDAGSLLNLALALEATGAYCYIDTHKIAYWTRKKMHKGRITGNGRIMAGSTLVIAHDQFARAIRLDLHPADTHLTHVIENYCADIVELTGISVFIIDREVNSARMARLFMSRGWQLLCLLSANEYNGLDSFTRYFSTELEDGTRFYKARWKEDRADDPRHFIIVVEGEEMIVYWGTPALVMSLTAKELVKLYRSRTEIQENSLKDMIAHSALDVNYGRKTIPGPDRTQQRKVDKLDEKITQQQAKLEKARQDIVEQERKLTQSIIRRHGALLETRQNKLGEYQQKEQVIKAQIAQVEKAKEELGAPGQREDRDFRKQLIMASRTAWLENQLKSFATLLSQNLEHPVDIETIMALFFRRSAVEVETQDMFLYSFSALGLSRKFQIILQNIIDGFNRISLCYKGKMVLAKIVGFS